jgi:hypothetical protein
MSQISYSDLNIKQKNVIYEWIIKKTNFCMQDTHILTKTIARLSI